jgi:CBS domain-containing protein
MMSYTQEQSSEITVSDVMRSEVLAAEAGWSLDKLAEFLIDNSITGAPVTDDEGELVGVVSMTDIVRQNRTTGVTPVPEGTHDVYLYELERHMSQEEIKLFHAEYGSPVRVVDIMTPMIFRVDEDTRIQEVADTMLRGNIHRVFVTRGNKLTGIVTTLDMLRVIRDIQ